MAAQLDPDAQALLDVMSAMGAPQAYELTIQEARAQMRAALVGRADTIALHDVRDVSLPTPHGPLAVRLFRPAQGRLAAALFLHGGGWSVNDLDTHDRLCRLIARRSGCLIAALDHRRAPEHKHPAALEDAHLAYRWLLDNAEGLEVDASALALMGESSGATTAACLSLLLADLGAPAPACQILAYPVAGMFEQWPSYQERASGYTLDLRFARWALENYIPTGQELRDPYLFPLASAELGGLPSTLIMTAEFDPLRDEGTALAERLASAGVDVEHVHASDQMHGFLLLDRALPKAAALIDRFADGLAERLGARAAGRESTGASS